MQHNKPVMSEFVLKVIRERNILEGKSDIVVSLPEITEMFNVVGIQR